MTEKEIKKHLRSVWQGMKWRCDRKDGIGHKYYYDKGITYCESWKNFENFYNDMHDTYVEGYQIDRIDNDKGYYPENCRWVTFTKNMRNKDYNLYITYNNEKRLLVEVCEELNFSYRLAFERITRQHMTKQEDIFYEGNLKHKYIKPIQPCICCGTLGGSTEGMSNRPVRRNGLCTRCRTKLKSKKNKAKEIMND